MAKSIKITSGSLLIGNPICVTVRSEAGLTKATFHRVILEVTADISSGATKKFTLSSPAGSDEDVVFDISAALRSVASKYTHTPIHDYMSYAFPYLTYTLRAYDEWMLNGILSEKQGLLESPSSGTYFALMGAYTDRERYLARTSPLSITTFTRKPTKGEVCAKGEVFLYPSKPVEPLTMGSTINRGPIVLGVTLTETGEQTFEGRTIYVTSDTTDRLLFQFVNSFGVIETISAEMLESLESSGETEVDVVTAPSSFGRPRQNIVRRSNREKVYKCSSGYVNREWAEWWTNEFFGGDAFRRSGHSQCWVFLDGNWLPCTVMPDDDIKLYDRTKPGLTQIEFEVRVF